MPHKITNVRSLIIPVDNLYKLFEATDNLNKLKLIEQILFKRPSNKYVRTLLGKTYWHARFRLSNKIKRAEDKINQ